MPQVKGRNLSDRLYHAHDLLMYDRETQVEGRFFLTGPDTNEVSIGPCMLTFSNRTPIQKKGIEAYCYTLQGNNFSLRLIVDGLWEIEKGDNWSCLTNINNPEGKPYLKAKVLNYGPGIEARLFL